MSNSKIENAIENGYSFRSSQYISDGWRIFSENPGGFIGFEIIQIIISMVVGFIPIIGSVIGMIISPPLQVGIPIGAHEQETNNNTEFGVFFKGFEFFGPLLIANIIKTLVVVILCLPVIFIFGIALFKSFILQETEAILEFGEQMVEYWWLFIVIGTLMIYIFISLRWTNYFIVFYKYDAIKALKTSWAIVNKNWFGHFGFTLMSIGVAILGMLALIVGLLVAIPVIYTADYAGFAEVTGLNEGENDIISEIGLKDEFL